MARLIFASVFIASWLIAAPPAAPAGMDFEYGATLGAVATGEAFPGYARSASDRGLALSGVAAASGRSRGIKFAIEGEAGGQVYERFHQLDRGWLEGALSARRGATQLTLQPSWTPHRVKFPSEPEDAAFSRIGLRAGVRQGFGPAMRLRVEGRFERDDFVSAFDVRDARERALLAQLDGRLGAALTLRASFERGNNRASGARYSHDDHAAGAGLAWTPKRWRFDTGVRSSLSRYRLAGPSDSNYRRRDQGLEWSGTVARDLGTGLEVGLRTQFTDQRSSRIERSYTTGEYRLTLSWSSPQP